MSNKSCGLSFPVDSIFSCGLLTVVKGVNSLLPFSRVRAAFAPLLPLFAL